MVSLTEKHGDTYVPFAKQIIRDRDRAKRTQKLRSDQDIRLDQTNTTTVPNLMAVARSASASYVKKQQQTVKTISTDRDIKPETLIKDDVVQPSDVLAIPIVSRTIETKILLTID